MKLVLFLALIVPMLGACKSSYVHGHGVPGSYDLEEVPVAIEQAETELIRREGSDVRRALGRMATATETAGLPADLRRQVQRIKTRAAQARLEELSTTLGHGPELEEIADLELPGELSVRIAVEGARQRLENGDRRKCYKLLKKLDQRYPMHAERAMSGALLAEAGLSLANDDGWYGLFFSYRTLAPEVLIYYTTNYPEDPRGPQAYQALAAYYQRSRRWDLAISYHEDLILFYPERAEAIGSRATIPQLRLAMLPSPEYDRSVLLQARTELEGWLQDHTGNELEPDVQLDRLDCLRRLADNDLTVARFYVTVGNQRGAELHARRGLEDARDGQDQAQIEEASALLEHIVGTVEAVAP